MKITKQQLTKIIKEELEAVLAEEAKTPDSVITDLEAKPVRRRMVIPDFEAIVDDWPNADPDILQYYPNWTKEDFEKVIDAFES